MTQPIRYFDCKLTIDGEDYSYIINDVIITNDFDTPYPLIQLAGDIDYVDIVKNKIYGNNRIILELDTFGNRDNMLDHISFELFYLNDNTIIPSRPHKPKDKDLRVYNKYYEISMFPKDALIAGSTYVNLIKHHTTIKEVLEALCNKVNLKLVDVANSIRNVVLEQIYVPNQSLIKAIEELQNTIGICEGPFHWFINYKNELVIVDANKVSNNWVKPIKLFLASPTDSFNSLKDHGYYTGEQDQCYILRTDIAAINAVQTNNILLRYNQKIGNFPDDKLYEIKDTTLPNISKKALAPTTPQYGDNKSIATRWTVGQDTISIESNLTCDLIRSFIIAVSLTDVTNLKCMMFDPDTYSFISVLDTDITNYVSLMGSYFISKSTVSFTKKQLHHWECFTDLLLCRAAISKV